MAKLARQKYLGEVPVKDLKKHPKNARRNDVAFIAESIEANDFYGAVVVQKSTGYVIAGNGRLAAAMRTGLESVPVIEVDVDDKVARRILLADNKANDRAGYDDAKLAQLLTEVRSDQDFKGTGFEPVDLDRIVKDLGDAKIREAEAIPMGTDKERTGDGRFQSTGSPYLRFKDYQLPMSQEEADELERKLRARAEETGGLYGIASRMVASV